MEQLRVTARRGNPAETDADTRAVGLFEGESLDEPALQALVDTGEAKGKFRKLALAHAEAAGGRPAARVIVVGLGRREEFDAERARVAAATVAGRAREVGSDSLSWAMPDAGGDGVPEALVEGTALKLYRFDRFKSKPDEEDAGPAALEIVVPENAGGGAEVAVEAGDRLGEAVARARIAVVAQNAARDLQNTPSNVATPAFLAERARALADRFDALSFEAFDRARIADMGMGAFSAVARGTDTDPQLIVLRYAGGGDGPHLGFVGKGVTFDTGGISIKSAAKMHEMKFDMSGAAAVIEAIGAIAALGLPATITAVCPATENMPSGHSTKPGDIVTAVNGTTIEINNTDAEGRLILADALAYAVDQGAERIIDLATLTGAIVTTFGSTYAGLFSNDDDWYAQVEAACRATGELGWRLPLHPEYLELTKGQYADLTNSAEARKAMSIYAAEFLRQFVDDRPWVHVDIAGVAWGGTRAYVGNGASGFGVRMLVELTREAGTAAAA